MISGLSSCLVETLVKNDIIENKQAPAYQYGFEIFISTIVTCIITLASGLILNCLSAVLLYFGLFFMLRSVCGGYHAGTYWQCNLTFLLVTIAVLLIYKYTAVEQFSDLHYCSIALSVLITAVYAPVENENKPLSDRQKKLFRILSIAMVLIISSISCLLLIKFCSSYSIVIDLTLFVVSVSVFVTEFQKGAEENEQNN